MPSRSTLPSRAVRVPDRNFFLLAGLLAVLWLAGGASRADVLGQVVVRAACWLAVVATLLGGGERALPWRQPVALLLLGAVVLTLAQLAPLPPDLWQRLPGRQLFLGAAELSGQLQPWRPWSIVPDATLNALSALIVPCVIWALASQLPERESGWLPGALLIMVGGAALVGSIQVSGVTLNNPLVNDTLGEVSGTFANRNHFALFLAIGCLLSPVWGLTGERPTAWRAAVGWGLVPLFLLMILASGSRAGLGLGVIALLLAMLMTRDAARKALSRYPRWAFPAWVAGVVMAIASLVAVSVLADRAVSIHRIYAVDPGQDMRTRGLPTVLEMVGRYFPFGTGMGGFDPAFRIHEPFDLLKLTYFNHAHNDYLETALDAGLPGILLLGAAVTWWGVASIGAWKAGVGRHPSTRQLGSGILFLVIVASIFDYPARTPIIMAVAVIAGTWLSTRPGDLERSPLPGDRRHL